MIRKIKGKNLWRLYTGSKVKVGKMLKHKNLGTFKTKAKAMKHEREVQFFKHRGY